MSNQPHPTRNATVPAPPLSPVVSRSTKSVRSPPRRRVADGSAGIEQPQRVAILDVAVADAPRAVEAIRLVAAIDDQRAAEAGWSDPCPPSTSATRSRSMRRLVAAGVGLVGQLARGCIGVRRASRSQIHANACARSKITSPERHRSVSIGHRRWPRAQRHRLPSRRSRISDATTLACGPVFPSGPDARRAAGLARAARDQLARPLQQRRVHVEERPAEADAAGIVVVDEDVRLRRPALRGRSPFPPVRVVLLQRAAVDRDADVVPVAHQQQLRHVPHRERQPDHPVAPIVAAVRQRAHHRRPGSSASRTRCASAARADPARPTRRSRSCRT